MDNEDQPLLGEAGAAAAPQQGAAGADDEFALIDACGDDLCFEATSCCGCCDVQVGTKIIAIMGVVQGLTSCMSVGTAGFLAMPTLLIGMLSIGFGLYGFWGAQKFDQRKIRIHFYWLVCMAFLLSGVASARLVTAKQFCIDHNCNLDREIYPLPRPAINPNGAKYVQDGRGPPVAVNKGRYLLAEEGAESSVPIPVNSPARDKVVPPPRIPAQGGRGPQPIPIYHEPCFISNGRPDNKLCTKAHQLSAISTIVITFPLNLYFAFVVRSLYKKVQRGELPGPEAFMPVPVPARPINVAPQIPPMAVYNAAALDGTPANGQYLSEAALAQAQAAQWPHGPPGVATTIPVPLGQQYQQAVPAAAPAGVHYPQGPPIGVPQRRHSGDEIPQDQQV